MDTFIRTRWVIDTDNFRDLSKKILPADREGFDVGDISFSNDDVFETNLEGGRRYLLNESPEDQPKALSKYRKMRFVDSCLKNVFIYLIFHFSANSIRSIF